MSGPKERTRSMKKERMAEKEANKRKERRSRSGARDPKLFTGTHDNTIVSSDEEQPSVKISKPAEKTTTNYRQALTAKYHKKFEANKKRREEAGLRTQKDEDLEIDEVDLPVDRPTAPLPAPVKHEDAPTFKLKDLLSNRYRRRFTTVKQLKPLGLNSSCSTGVLRRAKRTNR